MPNYCWNKIVVTENDYGSLEKFRKSMNKEDSTQEIVEFSFHQIVPIPEYHNETNDKFLYEWKIDNWGTKWEPWDVEVEDNEDEITIRCTTAWGPPNDWARNVIEKFDKNLEITLHYHEEGEQFYGTSYFSSEKETDFSENLEPQKDWRYNEEDEIMEYFGEYKEFLEEHFPNFC